MYIVKTDKEAKIVIKDVKNDLKAEDNSLVEIKEAPLATVHVGVYADQGTRPAMEVFITCTTTAFDLVVL